MGLEDNSNYHPNKPLNRDEAFEKAKRANEEARIKLDLRPRVEKTDYSSDEDIATIINDERRLQIALDRGYVTYERIEQYLLDHPSTQE